MKTQCKSWLIQYKTSKIDQNYSWRPSLELRSFALYLDWTCKGWRPVFGQLYKTFWRSLQMMLPDVRQATTTSWRHSKNAYGEARKISACHLVLARDMVKMIVSFGSLSELAHEILAQMLFEGCGMLPDCFRIVQNVKTQNRFVAIDSFVSKNKDILYCVFVELPQGGDLASANSIYHFGALFVFTSGFGSRLLPDRFQTRF